MHPIAEAMFYCLDADEEPVNKRAKVPPRPCQRCGVLMKSRQGKLYCSPCSAEVFAEKKQVREAEYRRQRRLQK